jgi:hypothetical protein
MSPRERGARIPAALAGYVWGMSDPTRLPDDDQRLDPDDDTVPPEHPAGADATVSAGEVLSGEGLGSPAAGPAQRPDRDLGTDTVPGDGS